MFGVLFTVFLVAPVLGWPQLVVPPLEKISVRGTFMCGNTTANGYKVDLFEEDLMFDDLLTTKFTDHNGHLYISATDSEFGGIKTYIEIYNRCFNGETKEGCVRYTKVHIPKEMANQEYELPDMDLNIIRPNEDVPLCGRPPKTTTRRQPSTSVQTTVSPIVPEVTRAISRVPSTRSEVVVSTTQSTTSEQATTVVTSEATSIVTSGPTTVVTPEATTIVKAGPTTTEKETTFVTPEATTIVKAGPTTTEKETIFVTSEATTSVKAGPTTTEKETTSVATEAVTNSEKSAKDTKKTAVTLEASTTKSESTTAMSKETEPITFGAPVVNDKVVPVKPEGPSEKSEAKSESKATEAEKPEQQGQSADLEKPSDNLEQSPQTSVKPVENPSDKSDTRSEKTGLRTSEATEPERQAPTADSKKSLGNLVQSPQATAISADKTSTNSEASPLKTDSKASEAEQPAQQDPTADSEKTMESAKVKSTNSEARSLKTDYDASETEKSVQQDATADSKKLTKESEQRPPVFEIVEDWSKKMIQTSNKL